MQSQRQKLAALDAGIRTSKPDRFTPLLAVIRIGLGDHWAFYEECIQGVLDAAAKQQDTTAWTEQMQELVQGIEKAQISHEGIMFLLRDMGVRPLKQQSWSEGHGDTGKFTSPTLSPHEHHLETTLSSKAEAGFSPSQSSPTMTSLFALRPARPTTPATAEWPTHRTPASHPLQQQSQSQVEQQQDLQKSQQPELLLLLPPQMPQPHQPRVLRDGVLPFDFSAPVLPGLTFPKNLRAYHYPPETLTTTKDYVSPPLTPLRESSKDPVFFKDEVLKGEVAEVFGCAERSESDGQVGGGGVRQQNQRLPYVPADDDLVAWKMRGEAGAEGETGEVKASEAGTWPPWNFRFDLEM